jgi:hypothetical protein
MKEQLWRTTQTLYATDTEIKDTCVENLICRAFEVTDENTKNPAQTHNTYSILLFLINNLPIMAKSYHITIHASRNEN